MEDRRCIGQSGRMPTRRREWHSSTFCSYRSRYRSWRAWCCSILEVWVIATTPDEGDSRTRGFKSIRGSILLWTVECSLHHEWNTRERRLFLLAEQILESRGNGLRVVASFKNNISLRHGYLKIQISLDSNLQLLRYDRSKSFHRFDQS